MAADVIVFDLETNTDDSEEIAKIFNEEIEEMKIDGEILKIDGKTV